MKAPFSSIPAVPAAVGMVCGIATAASAPGAGAVAAGCVALATGIWLWLWRPARFFAPAPLVFAIGVAAMLLYGKDSGGEAYMPPARGALAEAVYTSPMQGPTAAFAATTLLADGRYLQRSLRDDFRGAGLAHVLALSGFHVGIIAMLAMWLSAPLVLVARSRLPRAALVVAAVWAFAAIGGMSPSLVRAAVMYTLLLASRLAGSYPSPLNSLAVAALAILAVRPHALFDVGFQLSFAAVGGILAFASPLNPFDRRTHPRLHAAATLLTVPMGATMTTAPIVAATFGSLPMLFLPANILISLLFAPFYIVALAVTALTAAGVSAVLLARIADAIYAMMAYVADRLCAPVAASVTPLGMSLCLVLLACAALLLRATKKTY